MNRFGKDLIFFFSFPSLFSLMLPILSKLWDFGLHALQHQKSAKDTYLVLQT